MISHYIQLLASSNTLDYYVFLINFEPDESRDRGYATGALYREAVSSSVCEDNKKAARNHRRLPKSSRRAGWEVRAEEATGREGSSEVLEWDGWKGGGERRL